MVIEAGADKLEYELRLQTQFNFELAQNTAIAVLSRLEGKKPPTLQDTYPTLFGDTNHIEQDNKPEMWELYKEQFLDFANLHNKNRKKKEG